MALWAALENHKVRSDDVVRELVLQKAPINFVNEIDWVPIMYANHWCDIKTIELMIDEGADIHRRLRTGNLITSPASMTARANRLDVLKLYFARGVRITEKERMQMMETAAINQHQEMVNFLININPELIEYIKEDADDAVFDALRKGYTGYIQESLGNSLNPNARDKHGFTLLMIAAEYGHKELVKMLLDSGADPDATYDFTDEENTPVKKSALGSAISGLAQLRSRDYLDDNALEKVKVFKEIIDTLLERVSIETCHTELRRLLNPSGSRIYLYRDAMITIVDHLIKLSADARANMERLYATVRKGGEGDIMNQESEAGTFRERA